MRNYQFYIYESNLFNTDPHPLTGLPHEGLHTPIENITGVASSKRIALTLNKSGQVSFNLPIDSSAAYNVADKEVMRCIVVFAESSINGGDPFPIWSGPIWNVEMGTDSSSVSVTAVGWFEMLNKRELRRQLVFTNMDAGVIATRLLNTVNNQIANQNVVSGTTPAGSNVQRTGADTGATSAEDLLYGSGDFENLNDVSQNPSMTGGITDTSSAWAKSGASSLRFNYSSSQITGFFTQVPAPGYDFEYDFFGAKGQTTVIVNPGEVYNLHGWVNLVSCTGPASTSPFPNDPSMYLDISFGNQGAPGNVSAARTSFGPDKIGVNEINHTVTVPAGKDLMRIQFFINTYDKVPAASLFGYADGFTLSKNNVNLVPSPIVVGSVASPANPSGANRTRTYSEGAKVGPLIEELSQVEAGFDYEVANVIVGTTVSGVDVTTIRRQLNILYGDVKPLSSIKGKGQDRPNTIFGYRWGPNNLKSARKSRDTGRMANRVNGRSSGKLAMAQDITSINLRGLHEDSVSVSDAGIADRVLLGLAGSEVVFRAAPPTIYNVIPFPSNNEPQGPVPRFGWDYDIGDICYLVVDDGALKIGMSSPQAIRIFGISIAIDAEGNERIESLQTSAS